MIEEIGRDEAAAAEWRDDEHRHAKAQSDRARKSGITCHRRIRNCRRGDVFARRARRRGDGGT